MSIAEADLGYRSLVRHKDLRVRWEDWIMESFENRPCLFGSLVYPHLPHLTDIPKSVRIYTEQVLSRSIKRHPEPLRRVFVVEQTSGAEIRKLRMTLITPDGKIRYLPIKPPRQPTYQVINGKFDFPDEEKTPEIQVMNGTPDIPHIHFMMEIPTAWEPTDFVTLCEDRWNRMNWNRKNENIPSLAKVEVVRDLYATTRYIIKEFVKTQGENIILTHATMLQETTYTK